MSHTPGTPVPGEPRPTRRVMLGGAALAAVTLAAAGCRGGGSAPGAGATTGTLDPDIGLLTKAIADEEELLDFCTTATDRFPALRAALAGVVSDQHQHVSRLRSSLSDLTPPVSRTRPRLPQSASAIPLAVAVLAADIQQRRADDCLAATAGLLAELFGSVAASHAVTVQVLSPDTPPTPVITPTSVVHVDGLKPCLSAEYAAVYGYALLGGVVSAGVSDTPVAKAAVTSYDVHRGRRDTLTGLLTAAGEQPGAAEPAYDIPFPVTGMASASRLARYIEGRCAAIYAQAIVATADAGRQLTSTTLVDCATRGVSWGASPTAFPGLGPA